MKKTIYQLLALSVALLPALSCEKEKDGDGLREEGIRLTLSCDDIATRTEQVPGTGSENLIKTVDYFVFRSVDGNPDGGYLLRGTYAPNMESSCTFYIQAALVENGTYIIYSIVNYPSGRDRGTDFGPLQGGTKEYEDLQDIMMSERPLDDFSDEIAASTFTAVTGSSVEVAPESSRTFIMTGLSDPFTVNAGEGGNIKGDAEIALERLAAKVDMEFYVCNSVTIEKDNGKTIEVWTPMIDGGKISLALNNAVENAYIGGDDVGDDVSYFSYSPNYDNTVGDEIFVSDQSCTKINSAPFYTYPKSWSIGDDGEPFLKLVIPWKLTRIQHAGELNERTTTSQKELYYKIVLPREMDGTGFESNKWYRLELLISQLGSESDVPEFDLTCGYKVIDWIGDPDFVIAKIIQGLYLDVSNGKVRDGRTHYTMYSAPIEIPYIAANGVVTADVRTMTFTKYGTFPIEEWQLSSDGWKYWDAVNSVWKPATSTKNSGRENRNPLENINDIVKVDEFDQVITIDHKLLSDYGQDDYDISPFTIEFTLHLDKDTYHIYDKPITVTQYPPLYIEANPQGGNRSDGWVIVKGQKNDHSGSTSYDVSDDDGVDHMGSVAAYNNVGTGSGTGNNNPNLYKVSASILNLKMESGKEMVLGDAREEKSSLTNDYKLKSIYYNSLDHVIPGALRPRSDDLGTSSLAGYRKTDEERSNFVSPSFIIASSYGKTNLMTYEGALKRCAAYQEDGYPAGRWRLPTMAEIEFLIRLSDTDKIPQLFQVEVTYSSGYRPTYQSTSGYWAAGKQLYTVPDHNNSDISGFVDLTSVSAQTNRTYKVASEVYYTYTRCVYDAWYWGDDIDDDYTSAGTDLGYKTTR